MITHSVLFDPFYLMYFVQNRKQTTETKKNKREIQCNTKFNENLITCVFTTSS